MVTTASPADSKALYPALLTTIDDLWLRTLQCITEFKLSFYKQFFLQQSYQTVYTKCRVKIVNIDFFFLFLLYQCFAKSTFSKQNVCVVIHEFRTTLSTLS